MLCREMDRLLESTDFVMHEAVVNSCCSYAQSSPVSRPDCMRLACAVRPSGRVNTKRNAPNRSSHGGHVAYQVFQHTTSLLAEPQVPHECNARPRCRRRGDRSRIEEKQRCVQQSSGAVNLFAFQPPPMSGYCAAESLMTVDGTGGLPELPCYRLLCPGPACAPF